VDLLSRILPASLLSALAGWQVFFLLVKKTDASAPASVDLLSRILPASLLSALAGWLVQKYKN
jgi:uncharacterized membrane protein YjjB (DUF3815 family)